MNSAALRLRAYLYMNRPTFLVLALSVLLLIGSVVFISTKPSQSADSSKSKYPSDWNLSKVDGGIAKLSDYKGKVVLVNFWATWCGTCREEMPDMVNYFHKYKDQGFVVLGVNYGEDNPLIKDFITSYGMDFPNFVDPGKKVAGQYGVAVMPTSYLINRAGEVVDFSAGQVDLAKLKPAVERLLSQ